MLTLFEIKSVHGQPKLPETNQKSAQHFAEALLEWHCPTLEHPID